MNSGFLHRVYARVGANRCVNICPEIFGIKKTSLLTSPDMTTWIDTHCHLDAAEFAIDIAEVVARAAAAGVVHCVVPSVAVGNFGLTRLLAHEYGYSYALGIHPLCVGNAQESDLAALDAELTLRRADPRLVAVGEIGLDYFVPELTQSPLREKQESFYRHQLVMARKHGLPVILHVRRSADKLLKHLRQLQPPGGWLGIAHAFNGSAQQANEFLKLGLKLGFGGTVTFEAALQIRQLAATLPLTGLVMETDSPDIPPQWVYKTAAERGAHQPQGRNEPAELPRIAQQVAMLRGISAAELAIATRHNALKALPKLGFLLN